MNSFTRIIFALAISCSICLGSHDFRRMDSQDIFFSNSKVKKDFMENLRSMKKPKETRLFGDNVGDKFQPKVLLESLMSNLDKANMSDTCKNDLNTFYKDIGGYLDEESYYANHMLDAWGVAPQGGILDGNWRYPGRYYECRRDYGGPVRGQWCNAAYGRRYEEWVFGWPVDFTQGMCFPEVCSTDELNDLMLVTLSRWDFDVSQIETNISMHFLETGTFLVNFDCPKLDTSWSTADIIGLIVTTVFGTLLLFGTVVDLHQRYVQGDTINTKQSSSVLVCFSVISNTENIFNMKKPKAGSVVPILDGLRFFSTTWVILGHGLSEMTLLVDNFGSASYLLDEFTIMGIASGTYSVDTFFFIGGLLVCFLGMKFITKKKGYGRFDIPLMYLQRYIRLTPPYAFTILIAVGLFKYLGAGPYWSDYIERAKDICDNNWWTNLLYINNFYALGCMGWTWYLCVDWIFYILSPFLIMVLYKNRNVGLSILFFLFAGCIATNGYLTRAYGLQPSESAIAIYFDPWFFRIFGRVEGAPTDLKPLTAEDFKMDIYFQPWNRIHVYVIGMATGYLLFVSKMKIKFNKLTVWTGWTVCSGVALSLIYAFYTHKPVLTFIDNVDVAAFYCAVNRPTWGLCLSWIVIACSCGYGGYITSFLDHPMFMPLSKLTYSAYLVHFYVLQWYFAIQDAPMRWSTMNFVYYYIGCVTITFMVAYIWAILIEWPTIGLIKLMFPKAKSKQQDQTENPNSLEEIKVSPTEESSKPPSYHSSPDLHQKVFAEDTKKKEFDNKAFEKDSVTLL